MIFILGQIQKGSLLTNQYLLKRSKNSADKSHMRKILFLGLVCIMGCSMDASLSTIVSTIADTSTPNPNNQQPDPNFPATEIVTTPNGSVVIGTFGEISEKQILTNGVVVEGVFYE